MFGLKLHAPQLQVDLEGGPAGQRTIELLRVEIKRAHEKVFLTYGFCTLLVLMMGLLSSAPPNAGVSLLSFLPVLLIIISAARFDNALERSANGLKPATRAQIALIASFAHRVPLVLHFTQMLQTQDRKLLVAEFRAIEQYIDRDCGGLMGKLNVQMPVREVE